jgi:hypothetical protein
VAAPSIAGVSRGAAPAASTYGREPAAAQRTAFADAQMSNLFDDRDVARAKFARVALMDSGSTLGRAASLFARQTR